MDSAQNPLAEAANGDPLAVLVQKEIYPVKDSHSYISPYTQRDHAFTDGQYNQSDEVKWSKETNVTSADNLDWVVNEQGDASRLYPALAQKKNKFVKFHDGQSKIVTVDPRDHAWTDA
jgi:hypothetical protein